MTPTVTHASLRTLLGGSLLMMLLVVAIGADRIAPYDPTTQVLAENLAPPSARHVLGQDATSWRASSTARASRSPSAW